MSMTLLEFEKANPVKDGMIYGSGQAQQMARFRKIRDILAETTGREVDLQVINTHTSNSIVLPVVEYTIPDAGLTLTMRDNFFDVKVSVDANKPVSVEPVRKLFSDKKGELLSAYFEGFPREKVYGPHKDNPQKFSASVDREELEKFVEEIASQFKAKDRTKLKSKGLRGEKGDSSPEIG